MGIILVVNAWMVPFLETFGVEKGNGISPFAVSIDSPHALGDLVEGYLKIPMTDRRVCSTGKVDEYYKEVEEVDDYVPSVGNGAYNTTGVVKNHCQKIKKSDVDTDFNATDNNSVEDDTVNDKTRDSSKGVNSDTSIYNGVDISVVYDQFKELLICDSLDEVNVCALKLMELLSLVKLDKGATAY